jgi:hypothetical protein
VRYSTAVPLLKVKVERRFGLKVRSIAEIPMRFRARGILKYGSSHACARTHARAAARDACIHPRRHPTYTYSSTDVGAGGGRLVAQVLCVAVDSALSIRGS